MLQYDFEGSIGYWIFATAHELGRAMNDELATQGITFRQWEVLALISLTGEQSQSELAERMKIEAPTLVGVLDRMERDGWIQRVPDTKDRRRKLIHPTDRVEPVWNKMVECALRTRSKALAGFEQEEIDLLRTLLIKMRGNLSGTALPCGGVGDASVNGRHGGSSALETATANGSQASPLASDAPQALPSRSTSNNPGEDRP